MSSAEQFYEHKLLEPSADTHIPVSGGRAIRICKVLEQIQTNAKQASTEQAKQKASLLSKSLSPSQESTDSKST